jgi:hypothetical protein
MEKIGKPTDKSQERRDSQFNTLMEFFELNEISPKEAVETTITFLMSMLKRMKMTPEEVVLMFGLLSKAYAEDEWK